MPHDHVVAGLAAAGALTADAVALEARKAADAIGPGAQRSAHDPGPGVSPVGSTTATVTSLTARRLGRLPPDTRPMPSVAAYDQLLRRRRTAEERTIPS